MCLNMKIILRIIFVSGLQRLVGCYHRSTNLDFADAVRTSRCLFIIGSRVECIEGMLNTLYIICRRVPIAFLNAVAFANSRKLGLCVVQLRCGDLTVLVSCEKPVKNW